MYTELKARRSGIRSPSRCGMVTDMHDVAIAVPQISRRDILPLHKNDDSKIGSGSFCDCYLKQY
jgi:hypothetical protein